MYCIASAPTPDVDIYVLQLGGAVCDIDDDATPYTSRAAGYYWIVSAGWDHKEDDEDISPGAGWPQDAWPKFPCAGTTSMNMEISGRRPHSALTGKGNISRLAKLKARYDPANLFRLNQNIEPKP